MYIPHLNDNSQWRAVIGQHGVGVMNDNGRRLVEYSAENDMVIGGSLVSHKNIHKTTWTSPDAQIATSGPLVPVAATDGPPVAHPPHQWRAIWVVPPITRLTM